MFGLKPNSSIWNLLFEKFIRINSSLRLLVSMNVEGMRNMNYKTYIREQAPDHVDILVKSVVPFVGAETKRCNENLISVGDSKFCGSPDLPPDFSWPMSCDGPCHFVGQLNLEEVSKFEIAYGLPPKGLLSFFYHDAGGAPEGESSVVFYFEDIYELVRTPIVPDERWGMSFHKEHLYPRQFHFSQNYAIDEEEFDDDFICEFIEGFNYEFANSYHQFFGIQRYSWEYYSEELILANFGDWSDRLIFSISAKGLKSLDFTGLAVNFHCT